MKDNYINLAIGKTLESIMRSQGLTQQRLADRSGVPRLEINRVIGGKTRLRVDTLLLLLGALSFSPTRFFNRLRKAGFMFKLEITC